MLGIESSTHGVPESIRLSEFSTSQTNPNPHTTEAFAEYTIDPADLLVEQTESSETTNTITTTNASNDFLRKMVTAGRVIAGITTSLGGLVSAKYFSDRLFTTNDSQYKYIATAGIATSLLLSAAGTYLAVLHKKPLGTTSQV